MDESITRENHDNSGEILETLRTISTTLGAIHDRLNTIESIAQGEGAVLLHKVSTMLDNPAARWLARKSSGS